MLLQTASTGIVADCEYGAAVAVPSVVVPSAKRTRLTPKSSDGVAVSVIVAPRAALAGPASVTVGAASSTGIGAVRTGYCPFVGSDCDPLRYGKKSTALEVWLVEPFA